VPPLLHPNAPRASYAPLALAIAAAGLAGLAGCTPAIGDRCTLSTDCSVQGNRVCDTTQPNGYCTALSCTAGKCPDNAACVEIGASVPGCAYDDYTAPSRVGSAMCLKTCSSDSDCRQSDGYTCANPAGPSSSAVILDTNQNERVCLIAGPAAPLIDAQVCSSSRLDASPFFDGSASMGAASEAGGEEAEEEAEEAGDGGTADAGEGADAGEEADAADGDEGAASPADAQADTTLSTMGDSTVGDAAGSE